MQIDLSQLINKNVEDIEILEKIVNEKELRLKVRFRNNRVKEIKLNRFVDGIKFAFCLGLFGGEGTKRGGRGFPFELSNGDPSRIQKLMNFLKSLGIDEKEFSLRFQIRCNKKEFEEGIDKKLKKFWSDTLNIPLTQFEKSNIKIKETPNRSKFGTVRLRVNSNFLAKLFIQLEKVVGS